MTLETGLETRLLARLTSKKERLDLARPLPAAVLARLSDQRNVEWIYNSNAIEGSTLTLRETELILHQGVTIGGKTLREHYEVVNHRDAITFVEKLVPDREPLTAHQVCQIHALVLAHIDDENEGKYRTTNVRIGGSSHLPPEAWLVPQQMADWIKWLRTDALLLHPIDRAAVAHHRFAAIHPFIDGNGRTARLVMNLLLMREGYPSTIILRSNRLQYYRVLGQADRGKTKPLVNFVGRAVESSLGVYLDALRVRRRAPASEEEWVPLNQIAVSSEYSQEYLSLLARLGRLEAKKIGRVWHTTARALQDYRRSIAR